MRQFVRVLLVLTLPLHTACHAAAAPPSGGDGGGRVITRAEIEAAGSANVYDLIARLHAEFLNDRGRVSILTDEHSRATVFLNDVEYGPLESMRNIDPSHIEMIRYFRGTEAVLKFGAHYGGGVIQLVSRVE